MLLAFVLVGLGSTQSHRARIIGGTVSDRDLAVVRVIMSNGGLCTGTLIGPLTVLTAAHCEAAVVSVEFELGEAGAPLVVDAVAQKPHPDWNRQTGDHDLALIQLSTAVTRVAPVALSTRRFTEGDVGRQVRVVGYGVPQTESSTGVGVRREATVTIRRLLPFSLEAGDVGRRACVGDSGGPALLPLGETDMEYLAATVSNGDPGCQRLGYYARLDVDLEWVLTTARQWDEINDPVPAPEESAPVTEEPTADDSGGCSSTPALLPSALPALLPLVRRRRGNHRAPARSVVTPERRS